MWVWARPAAKTLKPSHKVQDAEVLPEDRVLDRLNVKDGDSFSAVVGMLG